MYLRNDSLQESAQAHDAAVRSIQFLSNLLTALNGFLHPGTTMQRPDWVHLSDRTWNRHSAFIMSRSQGIADARHHE